MVPGGVCGHGLAMVCVPEGPGGDLVCAAGRVDLEGGPDPWWSLPTLLPAASPLDVLVLSRLLFCDTPRGPTEPCWVIWTFSLQNHELSNQLSS